MEKSHNFSNFVANNLNEGAGAPMHLKFKPYILQLFAYFT